MSRAHYEYTTRSGDSLGRIIYDMYGWTPTRQPATYGATLKGVLALNPHVADPDRIRAGTVLRLPADPTSISMRAVRTALLQQQGFVSALLTPAEKKRVTALAWLSRNSSWLTAPGSIASGTTSSLLNAGNRQLLLDIGDLYADFKQGRITRTAYKAQRAAKLAQFKRNIGPLERFLYPKQGVIGAMRQGINLLPPKMMRVEAARLQRIAAHATRGGVVLAGLGVAAACVEIANTASMQEKNEIVVETLTTTTAGLAAGLFLVSSLIGWGTAVILAMGSTAVSYGMGRFARTSYSLSGDSVDLVSGSGLGGICR